MILFKKYSNERTDLLLKIKQNLYRKREMILACFLLASLLFFAPARSPRPGGDDSGYGPGGWHLHSRKGPGNFGRWRQYGPERAGEVPAGTIFSKQGNPSD